MKKTDSKKADPTSALVREVRIPQLSKCKVQVSIRGISPLVTHQFDEKAKAQMRAKQGGAAREKKAPKIPEECFERARIVNRHGKDCIRIDALKKSMIRAGTMNDEKMTELRMAFFIVPPDPREPLLLPIEFEEMRMREDNVRISGGTADLAYRPEYIGWRATFTIEYFPGLLTDEKLLSLINSAGWGVGIHEGRPEKTSALGWGRFELDLERMSGKAIIERAVDAAAE